MAQKNVLGGDLELCCAAPMTGYFRDGHCHTDARDVGSHTVCVRVTDAFLAFSKRTGNDLSTPQPGFPGLKAGDQWCLCASRWETAFINGAAPRVVLAATNARALEVLELNELKAHALDLN